MANLTVMKGVKYTLARLKKWLKEDGSVWVDIKRDEFRTLVTIEDGGVHYGSASGKTEHYNIPHELDTVFLNLCAKWGLTVFDCGFMVNNSFDLTRRTLTAKNKSYDLTGGTHHNIIDKVTKKQREEGMCDTMVHSGPLRLEVFLYDLPEKNDLPYMLPYGICGQTRRDLMQTLCYDAMEWLRTTDGALVKKPEHLDVLFDDAVMQGHEGLMAKRLGYKWVAGRTSDWMKVKPEDERDGVIVGWNPGTPGTEFEGLVGSVIVEFVDGSRASCSGMDLPTRHDMTDYFVSKYLGKIAEVHYMQRDSQGGYRHPNFYRLHPEKTDIAQCD
ncbi:putative ATP-dependent DNA ligase [Aeromonas phage phiA014L]|uniref:DNA ligase n=1 Tax=Aeromonas phage phiA014L TaxID=3119844 RepID=A0ABZ2CLT8_9CAUD